MARAAPPVDQTAERRPNKAAGAALIFLGAFNPSIFQPAWFARHGLIPDDEDSVQMEAVTRQLAAWQQSWLKLVCVAERFELHATDEVASYRALHDLAVGVFTLLPHVPLTAFGVNRFAHFQMESQDAWNALGFSLFLREPWEGILDDARMRTVQVESRRGEEQDEVVTVTVQPSAQFKTAVFVSTNDHYALSAEVADAYDALDRLAEVFDRSMEYSASIIERVRAI